MKKKILSGLLITSLIVGIIGVNAVSIEFEEIEVNQINGETSISYEEISNEDSISSEVTNEIDNIDEISSVESENLIIDSFDDVIVPEKELLQEESEITVLSSTMTENTASESMILKAYLTKADSVTYVGYTGSIQGYTSPSNGFGYVTYAAYSNGAASNSQYVIYSNAVDAEGTKYDLVMYPFKGSINAYPLFSSSSTTYNKVPGFIKPVSQSGYGGYKLVITEHGNINKPISVNMLLGISDLDPSEYVILPSEFSVVHLGSSVAVSNFSTLGKQYYGTTKSNTNQEEYNTNCVLGEIIIPTSGMNIYYGCSYSVDTYIAYIGFDQVKNYIDNNAYTINFNANGGYGTTPSMIIKYGAPISTIMGNIGNTVPTREGYTFKGWSANPELNNKKIAYNPDNTGATQTSSSWSYADYCNYTGGNSSNRALTLYAQWEANTYTITYNGNGNTDGSTASQTRDYGTAINLQQNGFTKTGYHFTGWNTSANGSGTSYSAGSSYNTNTNLTLYAQWAINTSTLKVNPNGGTWNNSTGEQTFTQNYNTTKDIPIPTREGHTFAGWKRSNTYGELSSDGSTYTFGSSNNATDTITAEWEANNYTVTINKGKGIDDITGSGTYKYGDDVTINATLLPGYAWDKWTGTHNINTQNYAFKMPASNVVDTANAIPMTYKIIYNLDGGSVVEENPQTYNIETNTFALKNPTREGYTFTGWTGSNGNTPNTNVSIAKGSTGDKNYVANWKAVDYKITYNLDGGSVTGNPGTYNIETNTFILKNPTKTGYTFTGWTGSNGNTPSTNISIEKGSTGDKSFTANWKVNQYNVTVNKGRGIESVTGGGSYDYGTDITITATLKPGYVWKDWTGTNNSTDKTYKFTLPASNVTETANAVPITYHITYNLDGDTVITENPATYNVETETFTLNNPTKEGYTFIGWTGSNGDKPEKEVTIPTGSLGDRNYTANWKVNQYLVTYIDVDANGNEIGKTTKMVDYGTFVRGSDLGDDASESAYYEHYKYVSDTTAMVTTNGAVVYRTFDFCKTETKEVPSKTKEPEIKDAPIKEEKPNNIPTGDTSPIELLIGLLALSFTGLLVFKKKRK